MPFGIEYGDLPDSLTIENLGGFFRLRFYNLREGRREPPGKAEAGSSWYS
jgi:hypothetical protein